MSECSNLPRRPRTPRRSTILDPEELGFEQRFDDGGAVDRDEGAAPAAAQIVNLPRDELLARAALPFDERGEVGGGHPLDTQPEGLHTGAGADERRRAVAQLVRRQRLDPAGFEDQASELRSCVEQIEVAFVQRTSRIGGRFQHRLHSRVAGGHVEHDRSGGPRRCDQTRLIPGGHFAQPHAADGEQLPQLVLEDGRQVAFGAVRRPAPRAVRIRRRSAADVAWFGAPPNGARNLVLVGHQHAPSPVVTF
jgi:hypothetical protein